MKDEEIIAEINELPVEQRVELLTQIFQGINVPDPEIEKAWTNETPLRLDEFEKGIVKAIPGN